MENLLSFARFDTVYTILKTRKTPWRNVTFIKVTVFSFTNICSKLTNLVGFFPMLCCTFKPPQRVRLALTHIFPVDKKSESAIGLNI